MFDSAQSYPGANGFSRLLRLVHLALNVLVIILLVAACSLLQGINDYGGGDTIGITILVPTLGIVLDALTLYTDHITDWLYLALDVIVAGTSIGIGAMLCIPYYIWSWRENIAKPLTEYMQPGVAEQWKAMERMAAAGSIGMIVSGIIGVGLFLMGVVEVVRERKLLAGGWERLLSQGGKGEV